MDHYIDIKVKPNSEISTNQILAAILTELHKAMYTIHTNLVGISFPDIDTDQHSLGSRLRLHSSKSLLEQLISERSLSRMTDYAEITMALKVPLLLKHRTFQRVQVKSNPERLRRRYIRRHGTDELETIARIPDSVTKTLQLPFLQLASKSTGEYFKLFISPGVILDEPVSGLFSSYGLSRGATVPWF